MTQQISSEEEEKTSHIQALMHCYSESVETNNKLMEKAASSMEEPDMAAFVQVGGGVGGCFLQSVFYHYHSIYTIVSYLHFPSSRVLESWLHSEYLCNSLQVIDFYQNKVYF